MNTLEMSTYSELDFSLMSEFIEPTMSEEEKEAIRKKTAEMYANFTDDDWEALGDNY